MAAFLAGVPALAAAAAHTPPPPLALVGATLLDGNGGSPVSDSVVVIRAGRIACAGTRETCPVPPGVESLDLSGRYLTPGLIDAHVHFSQSGWVDGRPDAVDVTNRYPYARVVADLAAHPERFFRAYLCSGITGVLDAGGYPWTWRLERQAENDPWAPHVEAAGPHLSTLDYSLNLPGERQFLFLKDEASVQEAVAYHADSGSDFVKVWYIPDSKRDEQTLASLVRLVSTETHKRGMRLLVHAPGIAEAREAVSAGADVLVHSIIDRRLDDGLVQKMFEDGTLYIPTLVAAEGFVEVQSGAFGGRYPLDCVDPGTRAKLRQTVSLGDGSDPVRIQRARAQVDRLRQLASTNLLQLHQAGIPIALGTDAGNPMTLHGPSVYAEMEAMQEVGLLPMDVLVAATRHGAQAMGRERDLGTVEAGKVADLLVLDADPSEDIANFRKLRQVIRAGVVHDRTDLLPTMRTGTER